MSKGHAISAKLEDYLEAILRLDERKGAARVRDIAAEMSVHKSTVTAALKNLADRKLVDYSPYEIVKLTSDGRRIAREISTHHRDIRRFLTDVLLVGDRASEENACRMEHAMDDEVLDRMALFARFVKKHPGTGGDWVKGFADFVGENGDSK